MVDVVVEQKSMPLEQARNQNELSQWLEGVEQDVVVWPGASAQSFPIH